MLNPFGSPVADQLKVPVPPVAVNVTGPYAAPTVPAGKDAGPVMLGGGALMVKESETLTESPIASVTVKFTL
jgi:hypothetical protein